MLEGNIYEYLDFGPEEEVMGKEPNPQLARGPGVQTGPDISTPMDVEDEPGMSNHQLEPITPMEIDEGMSPMSPDYLELRNSIGCAGVGSQMDTQMDVDVGLAPHNKAQQDIVNAEALEAARTLTSNMGDVEAGRNTHKAERTVQQWSSDERGTPMEDEIETDEDNDNPAVGVKRKAHRISNSCYRKRKAHPTQPTTNCTPLTSESASALRMVRHPHSESLLHSLTEFNISDMFGL
jgi:hypothetical protein